MTIFTPPLALRLSRTCAALVSRHPYRAEYVAPDHLTVCAAWDAEALFVSCSRPSSAPLADELAEIAAAFGMTEPVLLPLPPGSYGFGVTLFTPAAFTPTAAARPAA